MTEDAIRVNRALAAVQRALAISHLPDPRRQWLVAFNRKLVGMRDRGTTLTPDNRARLERLTHVVEDTVDRHRQALN